MSLVPTETCGKCQDYSGKGKWVSKAWSQLSQISKMENFVNIVNGFKPLTIFEKSSILDVYLGSEYTFELHQKSWVTRLAAVFF